MTIRVDLLTASDADAYTSLVLAESGNLLYASIQYRDMLCRILPSSEPRYLVARAASKLVGALPAFARLNARHGNVVNSLPFYGSHGGVLLSPTFAEPDAVAVALIREFRAMCSSLGAVASTVVENPLLPRREYRASSTAMTFVDERIGQMSRLPEDTGDDATTQAALFERFHYKTRNSIRKAQKSGLRTGHDPSPHALVALAAMHRENIEAVGGLAKSTEIFDAIRESFAYDRDYRVYVAEKDGKLVCALLVFFFNRTAEYYTPATDPAYREMQPMSLLIFEAMQEAVRRSCLYWNWGGTWLTQSGVYRFKSRWGTQDLTYRYQIEIHDPAILALTPAQLLEEYRYFYVAPFSAVGRTDTPA